MESDGRGVGSDVGEVFSDAGESVSGERKFQRKIPGTVRLIRTRMIRPLIGRREKRE